MPEFNPALIPSRSPLPVVLTAAGILIVVAVAVLYFNPRKTAELSVTKVQIFAAHTETKALQGSTHIIGTNPHADDDLYVLVTVKLTDKLRLPLFIKDETAILTAPDHSIAEASAIQVPELPNSFTPHSRSCKSSPPNPSPATPRLRPASPLRAWSCSTSPEPRRRTGPTASPPPSRSTSSTNRRRR